MSEAGGAVTEPSTEYLLYCDGASRGNPGPAATGWVLFDAQGVEVAGAGEAIGTTTNNVAEYTALLQGLDAALTRAIERVCVRMDSELVVRQILGIYRVKHPALQPLHTAALERRARFRSFRIEHVPRRDNARAESLANAALDALPSREA